MNRRHLTIGASLIGGLLLATITRADSPTTRPTDPNELAKLRKEVSDLRNENMVLRKVIEDMLIKMNKAGVSFDPQLSKFHPPLIAPSQTVPPSAVPHTFNGGIYYTIPVDIQQH
jgi:hypothetical protein